jgi:DNA (cytosine-5)-methyltransferase 3A
LSGSPCQDLSAAGKRAGINGSRSSLFFVFVEILEHIKSLNPKVLFFQENVGSASKLDVGIMSRALGVYPVRINSSLVTAQLRDRYYWSNIKTRQDGMFGDIITDIPQPKDKGIMFKDIITSGYVEKIKTGCLMESISRVQHTQNGIKSREKFGVPQIYVDTDKHTCLNTGSGATEKASQRYLQHRNETTGMITLIYQFNDELRVKTNTSKGFDVVSENDCIDLSFPNSKTRRARVTKGKSPCLMESNNNIYSYKDGIVRTVNKIEMCRLQGFPDNYCDILTTAKAGSLLGDGWTLPIIEHILSFAKF